MKNIKVFREGMKDGIPIALGYFAVSFSLGIVARTAGINAVQGFIASLFTLASAGEYSGFTLMAAEATLAELAIACFIINARYLLMSCSLSQKFDEKTPFYHRLLVAIGVTDEIFGISSARPGKLVPAYNYGAMSVAAPAWALGTALGILAGNILPLRIVSALSVALYGMFLAIIIPPAKKDKVIAGLVVVSFLLSYVFGKLPFAASISSGTQTIILTVLIAAAAALLFPVKEDESND